MPEIDPDCEKKRYHTAKTLSGPMRPLVHWFRFDLVGGYADGSGQILHQSDWDYCWRSLTQQEQMRTNSESMPLGRYVLESVGAQFEKKVGYKLVVTSDIGAGLIRRINAGEPFDFFSGTPAQIDGLIKQGRLVADTRINLVRSGIGVEVRAGAPRPDVSSVEAFKHTLLNAKSIAYLKEGASGLYLVGLLDRLGIADEIKSKVTRPDTDIVSELVAKGEVEDADSDDARCATRGAASA